MRPVSLWASSAAMWLDQPRLLRGLTLATPWALPIVGAAAVVQDLRVTPPAQRRSARLRDGFAMAGTVAAALVASRFLLPKASLAEFQTGLATLRRTVASRREPAVPRLRQLLAAGERRLWSPKEVHGLRQTLRALAPNQAQADAWMQTLIPKPQAVTGQEILGEIRDLSLMGLAPIVGGVAGGALGNAIAREDCREGLKNQVKEGAFQYLANIALCNVGAGAALSALERTPLKNNRAARLSALIGGITLVGVLGGTAIANFIGKNLLTPTLEEGPFDGVRSVARRVRDQGVSTLWRGLNDERHIEAIDVGLHVDDFALAGVFSGLKWITPLLALLYAVSGYRAGKGYRNGDPPCRPTARAVSRPPAPLEERSALNRPPVFGSFLQTPRAL